MRRVEGHSNLYKKEGNVIVNTDYNTFLKAKERKKEKQRVIDMESRLNRIEELLERLLDVNKT
jgi:hypothetical protein